MRAKLNYKGIELEIEGNVNEIRDLIFSLTNKNEEKIMPPKKEKCDRLFYELSPMHSPEKWNILYTTDDIMIAIPKEKIYYTFRGNSRIVSPNKIYIFKIRGSVLSTLHHRFLERRELMDIVFGKNLKEVIKNWRYRHLRPYEKELKRLAELIKSGQRSLASKTTKPNVQNISEETKLKMYELMRESYRR